MPTTYTGSAGVLTEASPASVSNPNDGEDLTAASNSAATNKLADLTAMVQAKFGALAGTNAWAGANTFSGAVVFAFAGSVDFQGQTELTGGGYFDFNAATVVAHPAASKNLTGSNIVRAWARCTYAGAAVAPTVVASFGVGSVVRAGAGLYRVILDFNLGTDACVHVSHRISVGTWTNPLATHEVGQDTTGGTTRVNLQVNHLSTGAATDLPVGEGFDIWVTAP